MSEPSAPEPDSKDWTWVLLRPCPDCGFDSASVEFDRIGARTREYGARLADALARPGAAQRPAEQVWSPLEYACHVRDVCRIFGARLSQLRGSDDPQFLNWDQDETALSDRYWEQDPATVAAELREEAERFAADLDRVRPEELARPGRRSNGSVFTVDTLARYALHDLAHHVHDVDGAAPAQ